MTLPFEDKVYIKHIAIDPALQGRGIGVFLYGKLIEKVKKNSVREIVALINLDNPKSIRLHEKLEFDLKDRKQACLNFNVKSLWLLHLIGKLGNYFFTGEVLTS